jgi:hypothetical protein
MKRKRDLTGKQVAFAREYCIDFSAKLAAIRAGYSKNGAEVMGHKLLSHPEVAKLISITKEKSVVKANWDKDRVISECEKAIEVAKGSGDSDKIVRALEFMGKLIGLNFELKMQLNQINLGNGQEDLTEEQRIKVAKQYLIEREMDNVIDV